MKRGLGALVAAATALLIGAGAARAERSFELATDPGAEIVFFSEAPGEMEAGDVPWLRVYADGRVRVHRPAGHRGAGDYELELGHAGLRQLIRSLVDRSVVEFDADSERAHLAQRADAGRRAGEDLFGSSDPDTITLELHLERYTGDDGRERGGVEQRIRWTGLRADARRYPDLGQIGDLEVAVSRLRALMDDEDLRPLTGDAR